MTNIQGPNMSDIVHTKGDTLEIPVGILFRSHGRYFEWYVPSDGDVIRFAVKSGYKDPEPILTVDIPCDTLELYIPAEKMKLFEARREPYVYNIRITMATGHVETFLKGKLYITEEVE